MWKEWFALHQKKLKIGEGTAGKETPESEAGKIDGEDMEPPDGASEGDKDGEKHPVVVGSWADEALLITDPDAARDASKIRLSSLARETVFDHDLRVSLISLVHKLHRADDTSYILKMTTKAGCMFYDADWCGILIADRVTRMWAPKYWYDRYTDGMTPTLFQENEFFEYFPQWVDALKSGEPLVIHDVDWIKDAYPEEYKGYLRLHVKSVIGAPFGEQPTGFLVVKNPQRYVERPEMLQVLALIGLSQYSLGEFIGSIQEENADNKKVRITLFGTPTVTYMGRTVTEENYRSPQSWHVLVYLALTKKAQSLEHIASALWPEEFEGRAESVRSALYRFRGRFATKDLIINDGIGYLLNPNLVITTDIQELEDLVEAAEKENVNEKKIDLLKQAFHLYSGMVYRRCADEPWLIEYAQHYALKYKKLVDNLLKALADEKDYPCIREHAAKALLVDPGNLEAHYYLILALCHMGIHDQARQRLKNAKNTLLEEEFRELYARIKKLQKPGISALISRFR